MAKSTLVMNADILWFDPSAGQLKMIQGDQIQVPLSFALEKLLIGRVGFDKLPENLFSHLKTALANTGANCHFNLRWRDRHLFGKCSNGGRRNILAGAAPAGMYCSHSLRMPEEHRQAVSTENSNRQAG